MLLALALAAAIVPMDGFSMPKSRISPPTEHRRIPFLLSMIHDDINDAPVVSYPDGPENTYFSPNVALDQSRYRYDLDNYDISDPNKDPDSNDSVNEYSFFDEAVIYVRAGSGGQGSSTFKKGKGGQDGIPDGGNGGKGGDVIMVVDDALNTLAGLTQAWRPNSFGGSGGAYKNANQEAYPMSFKALTGGDGDRQFCNGKYGAPVEIRVPPGTVVQEEVEYTNLDGEIATYLQDLGTLTLDDPTLVVAQGGQGGEGSGVSGKIAGRGVRRTRMPPEGGERKKLKLTLKIVADVALVGVPNAGKSTFLAAVTRAKPKIANYPFTTVIPNLGVWIPPENDFSSAGFAEGGNKAVGGAGSTGLVLCDVPGLVAGAANGVGLGHAFLRHVERCHVILHLVDATSNDPIADFEMLNRELTKYGTGQLAKMPQVVVINKVDAFEGKGNESWEEGLKTRLDKDALKALITEKMPHSRLMWMSAKEKEGVDDLMLRMSTFVKKVKETKAQAI
jgi:GTPase